MSTPNGESPGVGRELVSPRSMAELARASFSMVRQPIMRVAYEVHHVADRPGYLYRVVTGRQLRAASAEASVDTAPVTYPDAAAQSPTRFIETLTTAAHGTGLVVGTRAIGADTNTRAPLGTTNPVRIQEIRGVARWFSGAAVPNVSFIYDSTHVFEGLIAIGDGGTRLQRRHGRAILDVMAKVAELAAEIAHAPILSLQSPVQLPTPTRPPKQSSDDDREERPQDPKQRPWPRASAIAVRFAIALSKPTAELRLELIRAASEFCADSGFAFWVADTRSGFRAGNWFSICSHDTDRLTGYFERSPEDGDTRRPGWSVPLTFVGPARVGAIKSIVAYLQCYPQIGVLACSMSIIDDVAFIHFQLTSGGIQSTALGTLNHHVDKHTASQEDKFQNRQTEPVALLRAVLSELATTTVEPPAADKDKVANLTRKVGDFHLLVGPARMMRPNLQLLRRALWVSWEVEGNEADLSVPFVALQEVLYELMPEWVDAKEKPDGPNVEYLICRRVRHSVLRGKGKISFPNRIRLLLAKDDRQGGLSALSERIEDDWRAKLDPTLRVRELTVSWRENWLGHWTSPLD